MAPNQRVVLEIVRDQFVIHSILKNKFDQGAMVDASSSSCTELINGVRTKRYYISSRDSIDRHLHGRDYDEIIFNQPMVPSKDLRARCITRLRVNLGARLMVGGKIEWINETPSL